MSTEELEREAGKYHIGEYVVNIGGRTIVRRRIIIEQLLAKDLANNSRVATFMAVLALAISIVSIIISIKVNS